ncbi:hypothetical protein ACT4R9_05505 [Ornithobacterium rhinotracheale]|uniref:hypothetical protein n=1 Tax=Ornithobacterium rhinotracheale TaxID=28251 RepID=UPI003FA43D55
MAKKTKTTEIEEKAKSVSTPDESVNTLDEDLSTPADIVEENEFIAYQKAPFLGTFIFRGKKYKFRDGAPDPVRYNDEIMTLEELSQNEDYLLELIAGKSTLIEEYNG